MRSITLSYHRFPQFRKLTRPTQSRIIKDLPLKAINFLAGIMNYVAVRGVHKCTSASLLVKFFVHNQTAGKLQPAWKYCMIFTDGLDSLCVYSYLHSGLY